MNDVAVISANMGAFEKVQPYVDQSVPYDFHLLTDENFPPRHNAMTPRLQARIPKMFGWQMFPGYRYYIWVDSSCILSHKDSIKWFLEQLGENDIVFFKHPHRNTIGEEAEYLKHRLSLPDTYITSRYSNELLDDQMKEINDPGLPLYATTAFIYRPTWDIKQSMKEWWYHTSRYHQIDQLSTAYALKQAHIHKIGVINENFMKCAYLKPVRV